MLGRVLVALSVAAAALAQSNAAYCDATSGICFQGYTDPDLDITVGFVMPEGATYSEYIVQMVAPVSYGYTGVSMSGTMANGLLFVMWPNAGEIVFSTRWTAGYVQPTAYAGPTITMLPSSKVNSTHIDATFRCQNCTVWEGGSLGSGNSTGFNLIGYVASTMTPVDTPSNPESDFVEHDQFDFFGLDLWTTQSTSYSAYLSAGASSSSSTVKSTSTSSVKSTSTVSTTVKPTSPSTTVPAPAATQTKYGQCGGTGWTGPTVCASGSTCSAVSPPYYYQCT